MSEQLEKIKQQLANDDISTLESIIANWDNIKKRIDHTWEQLISLSKTHDITVYKWKINAASNIWYTFSFDDVTNKIQYAISANILLWTHFRKNNTTHHLFNILIVNTQDMLTANSQITDEKIKACGFTQYHDSYIKALANTTKSNIELLPQVIETITCIKSSILH